MKKIVALVCAVLLVALTVTACGTATDNTPDETADSSGTESVTDTQEDTASSDDASESTSAYSSYEKLEALDFGGETISVMTKSGDTFIISEKYLTNPGDIVQYNGYVRCRECEQLLNIVMVGDYGCGEETIYSRVIADVQSNTNEYDVYNAHMKFGAYLGNGGYNLNINKLPYVDLTQDYWNAEYSDNFSYKGYQFWVVGDIDKDFLSNIVAMFVNDRLWEIYVTPNSDDVFEMVDQGQWTLEKVAEYSENVGWQDSDGDTVRSKGDTFGWVIDNSGWVFSSIAYGAGYEMVEKNGAKYTITLSSSKDLAVYDEVLKSISTTGFQADFDDSLGDFKSIFAEDRALFTHNTINTIARDELKNMESYSTVPMPKMNDESDYITPAYDGVAIFGVLQTVPQERYEIVGAFLEAQAYYGRTLVTEAYYETALRAKYSKNEGSYRTLDLVRKSASADFAFCWTGPLQQIDTFLASNLMARSASIVAAAASEETKYQGLLDTLYTQLSKVIKNNK